MEKQEYVWDSGRIESGISVAVPYDGGTLEPEKCYVWKVYVWDKDGNPSESSEEAVFETGLTDNDWSGASWIGIREVQDRKSEETDDVTKYQIEYDVRLGRTKSGFVWGMDTDQYGEYMKCCVSTLGENIEFSIAECSGVDGDGDDKILLNEEFPEIFGSIDEFCETVHHIKLDIAGNVVRGSVDGIPVLETVSIQKSRELENIGLWTARGAYYAYYDNITITDHEDNIICKETFDNTKAHIFSPYYVKITEGWCEASSGFILTPGVEEPAPMLRCCFENASDSRILSARLYAASLGDYRIYLNGKDVCGEYLTPGRSVYNKEVYYRTYDVTELVNGGGAAKNVIGAVLGHGSYNKANNNWGDYIAFQAKLVIRYEDGISQTVVTDENWQAYGDGPIRNDDMYLGEYYDAAKEQTGWCEEDYRTDDWQRADVFPEYDKLLKKAAETAAVKCIETLSPVSVSEPIQGEYVYDFGQNFNGNCQITLRNTENRKGQVVTIRYAEALNNEKLSGCDDEIGTIFTENLFTADNTDYYVIGGTGEETYTPSLVCRGFRYVQLSGMDEPIPIEDVSGLVVSTDNRRTGTFSCSDERVNRLYD
ncbi:MAG: family 78 glycoside hydrolase catalytic domain, partial [Lachnospiraceae bacterium]|nr:family 78 glycoside hydrolase catalytic domain [Lachnospiraceae bacterium]